MSSEPVVSVEVPTLRAEINRDQVWPRMAAKYEVPNPVPPWKTSLDGMCDVLDCGGGTPMSFKERRDDEDALAATVYSDLPYPESQLMALAHSLVARGVISENALAERLHTVRARLES